MYELRPLAASAATNPSTSSSPIERSTPLLTTLPNDLTQGLGNKGEFAHWPPYLPRQICKIAPFTSRDGRLRTVVPPKPLSSYPPRRVGLT